MKNQSLTKQVVWAVVIAQVLGASALAGLTLMHERASQLRAFDVRLQGRADSVLGAIQDAEDPDDNVKIDSRELRFPADDVYAVYSQSGKFLGGSSSSPHELVTRRGDGFHSASFNGSGYRTYELQGLRIIDRAETAGKGLDRPVTIIYASPTARIWHGVFRAVGYYLLAIFLVALATSAVVVLVLRRIMRPLADLATAACQVTAPTLVFEPPASVLELRELRPLASTLTSVIGGLREAFSREQRFVGDAAHELKTAVAVVRSTVQLLMLRRRSIEEHEEGLERILSDNSRVEGLVAQMLQLARSEDQTAAADEVLDLGEIVESTVTRLSPLAEVRGIVMEWDSSGDTTVFIQNERALVLVANLVQNALQHSRQGSSILVQTRSFRDLVILKVSDHGSGIHPDALPHVFERFYREDASRSRETGGAGLGLAICKSIVESTGGTIEIDSTLGKGTIVTVTFIRSAEKPERPHNQVALA